MTAAKRAKTDMVDLDRTKSPNDSNKYRLVRLPNGLEAICIQGDPAKEKKLAACALAVQVGSFADPMGVCEGMAHYTEHMLFLGSEKYPGENEMEEFLAKHGGGSNAFTECEYTCYHFVVQAPHLLKALDMFANFFISPLMTEAMAERELEAIENEFRLTQNTDSTRVAQILCSLAPNGHPYGTFGWGNKKSLQTDCKARGVDINVELRKFVTGYMAQRMR